MGTNFNIYHTFEPCIKHRLTIIYHGFFETLSKDTNVDDLDHDLYTKSSLLDFDWGIGASHAHLFHCDLINDYIF